MNKTLTSTLEQLQSARVQVLSFSMRKQINLFDFESGPEISFNGFKSISAYQEKLDEWYHQCKLELEDAITQESHTPIVLKKNLDLARFEIKNFKNRFFPKENEIILFNRVKLIKTPRIEMLSDISLKKK
jgi:hypothetical protein